MGYHLKILAHYWANIVVAFIGIGPPIEDSLHGCAPLATHMSTTFIHLCHLSHHADGPFFRVLITFQALGSKSYICCL